MMLRKTPRYQQLKELIIDQISSGALKPSQRVPSENQLVVSMGVSRMTANRALRELNDGLVYIWRIILRMSRKPMGRRYQNTSIFGAGWQLPGCWDGRRLGKQYLLL